jgi:hypothetical protein
MLIACEYRVESLGPVRVWRNKIKVRLSLCDLLPIEKIELAIVIACRSGRHHPQPAGFTACDRARGGHSMNLRKNHKLKIIRRRLVWRRDSDGRPVLGPHAQVTFVYREMRITCLESEIAIRMLQADEYWA